jgi:hypothetical protein
MLFGSWGLGSHDAPRNSSNLMPSAGYLSWKDMKDIFEGFCPPRHVDNLELSTGYSRAQKFGTSNLNAAAADRLFQINSEILRNRPFGKKYSRQNG